MDKKDGNINIFPVLKVQHDPRHLNPLQNTKIFNKF